MNSEPNVAPPAESQLDLEHFRTQPEDHGLSLEELSTAYAELLNRGSSPYEEPEATPEAAAPAEEPAATFDEPQPADVGCDLTPKSILEAILFVGNTKNQPITAKQVSNLMRGVRPQEIDDLVRELNESYLQSGACYEIASVEAGYVLQLRAKYEALRDCFYGRIKEAKLTQSAIDVLAIVAYRQPITREAVDQIRSKPSGGILSQLLRRGLLAVERKEGQPKTMCYRTTDRFLQLFGLESLSELPQSQE